MGTTVDNVDKTWTCQDGKFYVGMRKEEAENMKNSLFINYSKEFDRVDKDGDGILSDEEVTTRKKSTKDNNLLRAIWDGIFGITFGVYAARNPIRGNRFSYALLAILMGFCSGMELQQSLVCGDEIKAHKAKIEALKRESEVEKDNEEALSPAA